jgi:hypothetical protein
MTSNMFFFFGLWFIGRKISEAIRVLRSESNGYDVVEHHVFESPCKSILGCRECGARV